jgi:hypothetical protein
MRRVIYSLYIDIPKEDLDYQAPYAGDDIPKTERTKLEFQKYYSKLLACKQKYANDIDVPFLMYEYDEDFKSYKKWFNTHYPQITEYNIVNFYKLQIMQHLSRTYDEILYLDFDVVPMTTENFFDTYDLSEGIAIKDNNALANKELRHLRKRPLESIRSPTAKYWNCLAMLEVNGYDKDNDVYNTGIVGASAKHIKQLNYFNHLDECIKQMDELIEDEMYPDYIRKMFGWDNETIWSYLVKSKNIPIQWLDWPWHLFYDKYKIVPSRSKFVHVINKKFEEVFEHYEKNNL